MTPLRCACGWERPLISLTTEEGFPPPAHVIPVYHCPRCGAGYVAAEISEERARRILRDLDRLGRT